MTTALIDRLMDVLVATQLDAELRKLCDPTIHGHKFSGSKRRDPEIRYSKSSKIPN